MYQSGCIPIHQTQIECIYIYFKGWIACKIRDAQEVPAVLDSVVFGHEGGQLLTHLIDRW